MASSGSMSTGFSRLHGADGALPPRESPLYPPRPRIARSLHGDGCVGIMEDGYVDGV
jgi:hypothetical protein